MTNDTFPKITQEIPISEEMASSNAFAGLAADALRKMASLFVMEATDLSSGEEDWFRSAGSATSFPHSHGY